MEKILQNEVKMKLPTDECALLLSGGVDSISVGFVANQLGKSIHAYSFTFVNELTDDYLKAQEVSDIMGWDFTGIQIHKENLIEDFNTLLEIGCKKKTHFECSFPFLYIYPEIKQKYVLSGWGADGYFGISKKAHLKYKVKQSKQSLDDFRDWYFQKNQCAGYEVHKLVANKWNKTFIAPYLSEAVKKYFYQFNWQQLNYLNDKPFQKHHIRNAFKEFSLIGKVKNHSNLQLEANIPEYFETLLTNKTINFNSRIRMIDVYFDWVKKHNTGSLDTFL
jgi:asparagine synthetase B (glutamine-hydrolysing)